MDTFFSTHLHYYLLLFRETFINMRAAKLFHYRCRLNNQPIKLDDFCHLFEFDPLSTET